jgi:hypothetical protein
MKTSRTTKVDVLGGPAGSTQNAMQIYQEDKKEQPYAEEEKTVPSNDRTPLSNFGR